MFARRRANAPGEGPRRSCAALSAAVTAGVVVLGACDAGAPGPEAASVEVHVSDSAGIRILESSPEVLEIRLAWMVDTLPDLEIGEVSGVAAAEFHRIRGMATTPGGEIMVVDRGSGELRWFDDSGAERRVVGGPGDGPGEFRSPGLIPHFPGDSALIFDHRARRFTWVAWDGSGHRVQPRPSGGAALLAGAPTAASGTRVAFRTAAVTNLDGEGLIEAPLHVRWVDLVDSVVDTITLYDNHFLVHRELAGGAILQAPFDQVGLIATGPEGLIVEGGRHFELVGLGDGGAPVYIARVDAPARPVDSEARGRLARDWGTTEAEAEQLLRVLDQLDLPDAVPAYQSLVVDRLGWTWAELFQLDKEDPPTWIVFDPEGRGQGVIDLPRGLEVHEIGEGHILGRWEDDLGVEYVRRHRLERGVPRAP